ncbi:hypothetical protein RPMD05_67 [Rhodobacteraceae phage LS06-2018-MD05]|nr:hypothetical protein RPMD05_67 [Rhodobacteraceae phage LS06-2018-MD05]
MKEIQLSQLSKFSLNIAGNLSVITERQVYVKKNSNVEIRYYQDEVEITKELYLKYKQEFEN